MIYVIFFVSVYICELRDCAHLYNLKTFTTYFKEPNPAQLQLLAFYKLVKSLFM